MARQKLKAKRLAFGLTQEEVAYGAGITRTYYTEIENGNRNCNLQIWLKIAELLQIPESELVSYMKDGMVKGA